MSNNLATHLDQALKSIEPSPAPVAAAMRSGRARRRLRHLAATGGVAAVAATTLVFVQRPATSPQPAAPTITVNPPGRSSLAGTIAYGTIGSKSWRIIETGRGCIVVSGTAFADGVPSIPCSGNGLVPGSIVSMSGFGAGATIAEFGAVRSDVAMIVVRLSDGATLRLHPVTVDRVPMVAFAFPEHAGVSISSAIAYTAAGQIIATSVPFQGGSIPSFSSWLRPGQHGLARASGVLAAGVDAYVGPWGICVQTDGASGCFPASSAQRTGLALVAGSGSPMLVTGFATPSVAYVRATWNGLGSPMRVPVVKIGPIRMFAFTASGRSVRWTAYTATGHPLASGQGPR